MLSDKGATLRNSAPSVYLLSGKKSNKCGGVYSSEGKKRRVLRRSCKVHQVPAAIKETSPRGCDKTLCEPRRI